MFSCEGYCIYNIPVDLGYIALVFSATVLVYSIHRIVGIERVRALHDAGRFHVISNYKNHIKVYILLSVLGCMVALVFTDMRALKMLLPLGVISLGYVIPFLPGGKRLRDIHFIKIILIAFVWAYVATIPLLSAGVSFQDLWVGFLEKAVFIFLITLPFDIRDMGIDGGNGLRTIPLSIGLKNTYRVCYLLLVVGMLLFLLSHSGSASLQPFIVVAFLVYGFVHLVIELSKNRADDLYYSGLMDGTLVMRGVVVLLFL